MPLFKSAIQTLSEMAIQESGCTIPQTADRNLVEEVKQTLANMPSLVEKEMVFTEEMVVVRKSDRLGRYLIEMEDLSRYMLTNGLGSIRESINNILEANGLSGRYADVAIVIDEQSILDEVEGLGYLLPDDMPQPTKGLGYAMVTKNHQDFNKIRRIANTKQLMDPLTGRYGLPLIKKNYKQEGLLEGCKKSAEEEDVELKKDKDQDIIHEEEPKDKDKDEKKSKKKKKHDDDDDDEDDHDDDHKDDDDDDEDEEESVEESAALDPHQLEIQRIKDIMAGKYDQF